MPLATMLDRRCDTYALCGIRMYYRGIRLFSGATIWSMLLLSKRFETIKLIEILQCSSSVRPSPFSHELSGTNYIGNFTEAMNTTSTTGIESLNWPAHARAYAELTKVRISVMVLFTFCVAGVLAAGTNVDLTRLFYATAGMLLIASSGNAMNMYLERYTDILMPRTAKRPLPAQKLSSTEVVLFASICFGASIGIFIALVNWRTAVCGIATWIWYVWIYTPLKTRTHLNTEVGAIPGALPILMGSLATTATVTPIAWTFFLVLLIWQFPHFMAIAWIYRDQYRDGGLQMLTVVDPTGKRAGRKAVVTCVALIAASLLPAITFATSVHSVVFCAAALALGSYYLNASIKFAANRNERTARRLLKVSIFYLPLYMLIVVIGSLV